MTKRISNYILADEENFRRWKAPQIGATYSLVGTCDGESVRKKKVILMTDEEVTIEGKVFSLEEHQKDYKTFIVAMRKNIPVVELWNIRGNQKDGYFLIGFVNNVPIKKKIVKKGEILLTLDDGKEYFVQWRNYSPEFNIRMCEESIAADDIRFPDAFEWFGDCKCKPIIPIK